MFFFISDLTTLSAEFSVSKLSTYAISLSSNAKPVDHGVVNNDQGLVYTAITKYTKYVL